MKIVIISGSPKIASLTRRVALHLKNWFSQNSSHEIDIIDMKDWNVPAVQSVWVSPEKAPVEFQPLAEKIFNADAYILVTPEYNGSYSPAMKNLLDHFPKRNHKPFGIVTASPGAMGGIRASQQLLQLVPALFGIASPYMLIIPAVDKKFTPDGDLLDESFQNAVHNFITEFLWLAEKVVETPVESFKG
jgi:NAD(P)H-dependent FMN reductase